METPVKLKSNRINLHTSFRATFLLAMVYVEWKAWGFGDFILTSAKDGKHRKNSAHKHDKPKDVLGQAFDIRTWEHWDGPLMRHSPRFLKFADHIKAKFGPIGLAVVVHPDHVPGSAHLHISFMKSKGTPVSVL